MTELEQEIRSALRPRRPTEAEVDAWTREALDGVAGPARPHARLIWVPLACAAVLAGVFVWRGVRPDTGPVATAPAPGVNAVQERAANREFLERGSTLIRMRNNIGQWAVIAGAQLFVGADATDAFTAAERAFPRAEHRFVFRITGAKPPFDVKYENSVVGPGMGGDAVAARIRTSPTADASLQVAGRAAASYRITDQTPGPLVLRDASGLERFETPGAAIIEHPTGMRRIYQRYLVPVRFAEFEGLVAAAAGPETLWYANRAWGPEPNANLVRGRNALVLLIPSTGTRLPARVLDGLKPKFLDQFAATSTRFVSTLRLPNGKTVPMQGDRPAVLAVMRDGVRAGFVVLRKGLDPTQVEWSLGTAAGFERERTPPELGPGPERLVDRRWLPIDFARLGGYDGGNAMPGAVTIPERLRKLSGREVVIRGYVIPIKVDPQNRTREFVLVKDQMACCFGVVPKMNEWIHVTMKPGKLATVKLDTPVAVCGTLEVGELVTEGVVMSLYRVKGESVAKD
ncbi:MAG: DUF3299 domain-containing protein [Planctomycetota bacterium]|nr:DUF3299 domain-containing protein [Planctomycetota bacterium]